MGVLQKRSLLTHTFCSGGFFFSRAANFSRFVHIWHLTLMLVVKH